MPLSSPRLARSAHRGLLAIVLTATSLSLGLGFGARPALASLLYSLTTKCSLKGAAAQPCTVEAVNEAGATLYRHRIGAQNLTVRITDQPSRLSLWNAAAKTWEPLRNAAVQFSTNTLCFNNRELCVVNPNYLNSLLQDRPDFRGRDLVQARFGADGRVDLTCYDQGCALVSAVMEVR